MSGYKTIVNGAKVDLDDIFQKSDSYENKSISSKYKVNSNTLNGRYISRSSASSADSAKHVGYLDSNNNDLNISFFRPLQWTQKQKLIGWGGSLTLTRTQTYDYFGHSVAIYNNYAIVGAWGHDANGELSAGAAYIFERQSNGSWTQKQKLIASDKQEGDNFGKSVAIYNNYAIVGAPWEDANGVKYAGAAYIFENY